MLLASIKIQDDIRDGWGVKARFYRWIVAKQVLKAYEFFTTLDCQFTKRIEQVIGEHLDIENSNGTVSLRDYVEPTAKAFSYVFGLMATYPNLGLHQRTLSSLGRHIGSATIAHDCAADWKQDKRWKLFNPVPDEEAARNAVVSAFNHLCKAIEICHDAFGEGSRAMKVLLTIRDRTAKSITDSCAKNVKLFCA